MTRPVIVYLAVAFGVTWGIVIPAWWLFHTGKLTLTELNLVYNLGAAGPLCGALTAARIHYGKSGIRSVFSVFRFRNTGRKAWLIALAPLLFLAFGLIVYPLLTGHPFTFNDTRAQFVLTDGMSYLGWLLPFVSFSLLEEFGWRGFLLPHFQDRFTAVRASLLTAIAWALWHAPFFLWRFDFSVFISIGFFFSLAVGSLILTCLFNLSHGSIAPVILFHFLNNLGSALDRQYLVAISGAGCVLLGMWLIRRFGPAELCDGKRPRNPYFKTASQWKKH